jgi:hypothetical protein
MSGGHHQAPSREATGSETPDPYRPAQSAGPDHSPMTDPFPRISSRVEAEPASIEVPNQPPIPEFTASDVSGTGGNPAHTSHSPTSLPIRME